jgi:L-threonylcarbamoyladenylate synthase
MKYTHYAPKGELVIVEADDSTSDDADKNTVTDAVVDKINSLLEEHPGAVVLTTKENADRYNTDKILLLGEHGDGPTVAARLYSVLRECDDMEAEFIISESFDRDDYGGAIMNRLLRAAGQRVIKV